MKTFRQFITESMNRPLMHDNAVHRTYFASSEAKSNGLRINVDQLKCYCCKSWKQRILMEQFNKVQVEVWTAAGLVLFIQKLKIVSILTL